MTIYRFVLSGNMPAILTFFLLVLHTQGLLAQDTSRIVPLQHNSQLIAQLDSALAQPQTARRAATLAGLRWCIRFIDDDDYLFAILSDWLQMLYELSLSADDTLVKSIAVKLAHDAFMRTTPQLSVIFPSGRDAKWDFISMAPFIYWFNIEPLPWLDFYAAQFRSEFEPVDSNQFRMAVEQRDYDLVSDILIDYYFVDFLTGDFPMNKFALPVNRYSTFMQMAKYMPIDVTLETNPSIYSDQNYHVTHLVYLLTDYGRHAVRDSSWRRICLDYLEQNFEDVLSRVDDMDLLAEFVHCLKILRQSGIKIDHAEQILISKQLPDGSWSTAADRLGSPYTQFHPTWAVVTALIYSPAPLQLHK